MYKISVYCNLLIIWCLSVTSLSSVPQWVTPVVLFNISWCDGWIYLSRVFPIDFEPWQEFFRLWLWRFALVHLPVGEIRLDLTTRDKRACAVCVSTMTSRLCFQLTGATKHSPQRVSFQTRYQAETLSLIDWSWLSLRFSAFLRMAIPSFH